MEKIVRQTLLFDLYSELLTEHQREIYEDVILGDIGYSEVAEREGVSRQSVHDLVKRTERQLEEYEQKLMLLDKLVRIRSQAEQIRCLASQAADGTADINPEKLIRIADEILEEL